MPPSPPIMSATLGATHRTLEQLHARKKNGHRLPQHKLKLRDEEAATLDAYCKKFSFDRYHMPDAPAFFRLLEKLKYAQHLKTENDVFEIAYRVGMIFIENYAGKKGVNDGNVAKANEVEELAKEVAKYWKKKLAKKGVSGEHHHGEENGEENGEEAEEEDGHAVEPEDQADNDNKTLVSLENAWATPVIAQTPASQSNTRLNHRTHTSTSTPVVASVNKAKAQTPTIAATVNPPKTPASASKIKTSPKSTPGLTIAAPVNPPPTPATVSKFKTMSMMTARLYELDEQIEAFGESLAKKRMEVERLKIVERDGKLALVLLKREV
ncbi:unnamed protein product [Zymoseptoria tritici ST99CH_3D7]|uniref:Uncharacterized protein n=1 Tax=Zymoseptoria tritici (strain ST99CH_3D7) TaxID=1276538 RepID=A0A1X7S9Q7_ZYMT9|nr:unnamed protein product [Zymoseptoria tritici ST99CH_3D7]